VGQWVSGLAVSRQSSVGLPFLLVSQFKSVFLELPAIVREFLVFVSGSRYIGMAEGALLSSFLLVLEGGLSGIRIEPYKKDK